MKILIVEDEVQSGEYLKQGGQWGPHGVKTVVQQILAQSKADSIVDRLRDELKSQIKP